MSRRTPLKATHVLMWSSPVLLLVLVFTLGSNTSGARPLLPTTTSSPATTTSTTTLSTVSTTSTTLEVTTTVAVTTPTTRRRSDGPTATTAPTHGSRATNAVVAGSLDASLSNIDVPLTGPGTWTLTTTGPTTQRLYCSGQSSTVIASVVVAKGATCQFEIAASNPGVPIAWQLTRTS